jgi:serine protease Do
VACSAFDGQLVRYDFELQKLMEQFVRVRIVQGNALDLSVFQFDTDLTFAAFFLNADRTVYGRFGSRSEQKRADKDITMEGFREAMAGALELHRNYPTNKSALAGKQTLPVKFKTPEQYPGLGGKYTAKLNYASNKVASSCIHCHQVGESQRKLFRADNQPIPDEVLHPWPMPDVVGLSFDPKSKAKLASVAAGSAADTAGFKAGDELVSLEGQPLLSIADVQWVLHQAKVPATLKAAVRREGRPLDLALQLEKSWRQKSDISWRSSTWDLRRMALGGLVLKELDEAARSPLGLADTSLALRVDYVGQYGEHAAGKKAGFKKEDIIVICDDLTQRMSESDLLRNLLQKRMPGSRVPVTVLRGDEKLTLELPLQ